MSSQFTSEFHFDWARLNMVCACRLLNSYVKHLNDFGGSPGNKTRDPKCMKQHLFSNPALFTAKKFILFLQLDLTVRICQDQKIHSLSQLELWHLHSFKSYDLTMLSQVLWTNDSLLKQLVFYPKDLQSELQQTHLSSTFS